MNLGILNLTVNNTKVRQDLKQTNALFARLSRDINVSFGGVLKTTAYFHSIMGTVRGLAGAGQQLKDAFDLGGELTDAHEITGVAIDDLAIMRQAYVNAGRGADDFTSDLNRMQKALGGVNEDGDPTNKMFARLRLNVDGLKKLGPAEQFELIRNRIARIEDPTERATVAMGLFGKSGARSLAVFRDPRAFGTAAAQVGKQAEILKDNAQTFDAISDAIGASGTKIRGFYVGLASSIAPDLEKVVDDYNAIDLAPLGRRLGRTVADAFRGKSVAQGLADLGGMVIRGIGESALALGDAIAASLLKAFASPIAWVQAQIEVLTEKLIRLRDPSKRSSLTSVRETIAPAADWLGDLGAKIYDSIGRPDLAERKRARNATAIADRATAAADTGRASTVDEVYNRIMADGGPRLWIGGSAQGRTADQFMQAALDRLAKFYKLGGEGLKNEGRLRVPGKGGKGIDLDSPADTGARKTPSVDRLLASSYGLFVRDPLAELQRSQLAESRKQTGLLQTIADKIGSTRPLIGSQPLRFGV